MKKSLKRISAIFMIVLTLFSCCSVALAATTPNVEIEVVYDENGNRVGFKTIKINDKIYYDILDGEGNINDLSVGEFYKKVLSHRMYDDFPLRTMWSAIATDVFELAGRGYGYNWEFGDDFSKWYRTNIPGTSGNDEENAMIDLPIAFEIGAQKGKLESHCVRGTGFEMYSSLDLVQEVMLEQIVDVCGERNDAEEFKEVVLEFCTGDKDGFELFQNNDEQPVLASIVTNQYDCDGYERYFSSFGLVLYDFKLTPIIDENLQYISATDNYDSIKDAFENSAPGVSYTESGDGITSINYIQNPTNVPASVSASSSKSDSTSISNSFTDSDSYSYTESVSVNAGIKISDALKLGVNVGFSASQAISTAYSESTSVSESTSTSSSASVTLPPYTELGIKQTMSSVEQSVEYNCPVYVTYKAAVFGLNSQYFQDTDTGSWSITNYDQGSIFVGFGSDSKIGGVNAVENFCNRLDENSFGFELSYGNTFGMWEDQNDGNPPLTIKHIDWDKSPEILRELTYIKDNCFKTRIPMSSMGGKMFLKTESYNTEITEIYPMYDLEKVRFEGDGTYNLAIGGDLDLNMINVVGLNKLDQPYYGFRPTMGTWHLCDEDGNDIPAYEEGKGISVTATPSTQVIEAHELGDYYLRFDIDENYYKKAVDRKTYITNDDLDMTAILKLSVTDTGNNHTCRAGSWVTSFTPTCVSSGERCKFCLTCGKRMAVEVLPKAGHLPVEIIEPATCTMDGRKYSTCAACRVTCSSEVIPATGHGATTSVTTTTPTCTLDGEKTIYCSDCNMIVGSEKIEATGHDDGVWKVDFEATAEHDGQMTRYCSECNKALESKSFGYHRHSYSAWTNLNDDCHVRYCDGCDATETAAHLYGEYVSNNDATENSDGTKTATCSVCSDTKTVTDEGSKLESDTDTDTDTDSDTDTDTDTEAAPQNFFQKLITFLRNLFKSLFEFLS